MGKKYMDTKKGSLESSVLDVWQDAVNKEDSTDAITRMDGRTKSYRQHRAKLEAARQRREAKKLDAVGKEDDDVDNDGDTDSSDEYLKKRRKAISKAIKNEELDEKLISARGKDIAQKMNKSKTMKAFAKKVAQMQTVTPDKLERMLPDYVAGKDIYSMFEEVELDEGGMKRLATGGKAALKGFKKKPKDKKNKKEEVEEEVADQYTEASYFTVQSMRDRLHQVWGEAKEEFPDHKDDEKKIKGKKSKTDTGKDAAVVDVKPEIKERKK